MAWLVAFDDQPEGPAHLPLNITYNFNSVSSLFTVEDWGAATAAVASDQALERVWLAAPGPVAAESVADSETSARGWGSEDRLPVQAQPIRSPDLLPPDLRATLPTRAPYGVFCYAA